MKREIVHEEYSYDRLYRFIVCRESDYFEVWVQKKVIDEYLDPDEVYYFLFLFDNEAEVPFKPFHQTDEIGIVSDQDIYPFPDIRVCVLLNYICFVFHRILLCDLMKTKRTGLLVFLSLDKSYSIGSKRHTQRPCWKLWYLLRIPSGKRKDV